MINAIQGTPGSGKSAACVAMAIDHLRKGGVVAANFQLVDGWADQIALRHPLSRFSSAYRYKLASSLYQRFFYVDSLDAIRSINPKSLSVGTMKDDGTYYEGAGLLILDECQLVFNSRKWDKNMGWIEFFTQHRKLGWNVLLIAHTLEMIDSQIRPLCEYESRFRNLQKVRLPLIGLPLSPIPAFLVITRYAGLGAGASTVHSRNLYKLPIWAAKLYDTLLVFSPDMWQKQSLPVLCGEPPSPHCGEGGLIDRVSDWWRNLGENKRKPLSQLSSTCLWSKYLESDNVIELTQQDAKLPSLWPLSLNT